MSTSNFTTARWVATLRTLPPESAVLHQNSYRAITGLSEKALRQACWRLGKQGLLTHLASGFYTNAFHPATLDEAAAAIIWPSYVSLETVLRRRGIVTAPSMDLTCVTTKPTATRATPLGVITYRSIATELFFGFATNRSAHGLYTFEAYPEKALLDLIYLNGRTGAGIWMDFEFRRLNQRRLAEFTERFPAKVAQELKQLRRTHKAVS